MTPLNKVKTMYAAFSRGDIPAILSGLAPDVEWEYGANTPPVPWLKPRRGRDAVAGFFEALKDVDIVRFEPTSLVADGNLVIALFDIELIVKATGKRVTEIDEVHIWRFNQEGLVQKFRHQVDSWTLAEAIAA